MKTIRFTLLFSLLLFSFSTVSLAGNKLEKRYDYTLMKLKLDKATKAKFAPVLRAFLEDYMAANDRYDELKKKYKSAEKAGTLTDSQATQLLEAKFDCDARELAAKKKHLVEFKKVLPMKKVWYVFDYATDKMSKIEEELKD